MNRLEKAIERVEKSVNISFAGPTPTSLLARQDLESSIVVLSDRQTPFRDRVSRIKGEGLAHLWNQRTRLDNIADGPAGLVNLFYADGNLPNTTDPNYVQQTAAYKYLGTTAVITGPMIASGRSYIDIEAEVAEATLRRIIQAEEWADFKGSTSANSLSFNGFDFQQTTNVVSAAGAALTANGVTIPLFDKIVKLIRIQGGSKVDGIYCSFGQQNVINQIVSAAARYVVALDSRENIVQAGDHVVSYMGALGAIPVIGDFFVNAALPYPIDSTGSSGSTGNGVSNIYFLRHDEQGVQMADLVPLGRTELAKIADTIRFYVNIYLTLALKAEPWTGQLTQVQEPS